MLTDPISVDIGLCRIDMIDMKDTRSRIRYMRVNKIPGYVVTPNVDHLARIAANPHKNVESTLYLDAALSVCDSRILELILKVHGVKLPEVVTGSDLTAQLLEFDVQGDDRVYILGGNEQEIDAISKKYPHLKVTHRNPTMGFIRNPTEVEQIIVDITSSDPDYVFLAVGSPQQEIVARELNSNPEFKGVALCIGASLLFLSGAEKRAPKWIQNLRMEWLYRMIQSPSRLAKRYIKNAIALPSINRKITNALNYKMSQ